MSAISKFSQMCNLVGEHKEYFSSHITLDQYTFILNIHLNYLNYILILWTTDASQISPCFVNGLHSLRQLKN